MKILYQFTDQWTSELHNKNRYVKELIQSIIQIYQKLKQYSTIHWSHKFLISSSVLINKQLPQLIKILSEPQAEAVYW